MFSRRLAGLTWRDCKTGRVSTTSAKKLRFYSGLAALWIVLGFGFVALQLFGSGWQFYGHTRHFWARLWVAFFCGG